MSQHDINLKDLTIAKIREFVSEHSFMCLRNPGGELFQCEDGLIVDVQSLSLLSLIYDTINEENKERFRKRLNNEYMLAQLFDKMWSWVK